MSLLDELATPLTAAEVALCGRALGRFLCTICLGTGKLAGERKATGHGHQTKTCGQCKETGQRWRP